MKRKRGRERQLSTIDIKIDGAGVGLRSVSARALAELLQAAASAVEATAHARGVEVPEIHLVEVRGGSAAYSFVSSDEQASAVLVDLYEAAKTRGRKASPGVRHALKRLHGEATKIGSLRLRAKPVHAGRVRPEITVAAPVDDPSAGLEAYDDIHGRIVGLYVMRGNRLAIHVRLEEGHTEEFFADPDLLTAASALFNSYVRARVVYVDEGDQTTAQSIEKLEPWDRAAGDFSVAVEAFRQKMQSDGIEIDASAWLRELHADD